MASMSTREWELDERTHRNADDSRAQITLAKVGAHVAATDDYLRCLRQELLSWVEEIETELFMRARAYEELNDSEE